MNRPSVLVLNGCTESHIASGRRKLDAVGHYIHEHTLDMLRIHHDITILGSLYIHCEVEALVPALFPCHCGNGIQYLLLLHCRIYRYYLSCIDPAGFQNLFNQI